MISSTIPRLELLGNLLLSRLMNSVENSLSKVVEISGKYFWTDSQITLAWITSPNKEYKVFVENRVQEIRKYTNIESWFYCETAKNPADLLTRLKKINDFKNLKLWWHGPEFLWEDSFSEFTVKWSNRDLDDSCEQKLLYC